MDGPTLWRSPFDFMLVPGGGEEIRSGVPSPDGGDAG